MELSGRAEELEPLPVAERRGSSYDALAARMCTAMIGRGSRGEQLVLGVAVTGRARAVLGRFQPV
jgi:hypothetical protein